MVHTVRLNLLQFLRGRQKCVDGKAWLGAILIEGYLREQLQALGGLAGEW